MRVPFYPQIYADKFAKKEARALLQLLAGLGLCLTFPTSPSPLRVAGVGCVQPICDPPRHNCPTDAQKKYCACVDGSRSGRASTKTRTLSSTRTAIQVELKCAGCTKIKVCRVDGVDALFQARHRLVLNPDVAIWPRTWPRADFHSTGRLRSWWTMSTSS